MHTVKFLKAKNHIVFSYNKENFKKYVLGCILTLITSLLKSREFGQYFKNFKKIFCFVLVSGITNLYLKCIFDIKNVFLLTTKNNWFYPIR
jgi:hypothetical protein